MSAINLPNFDIGIVSNNLFVRLFRKVVDGSSCNDEDMIKTTQMVTSQTYFANRQLYIT